MAHTKQKIIVTYKFYILILRSPAAIVKRVFDLGEPRAEEAAGSVCWGRLAVPLRASLSGEEPAYSGERGPGQEPGPHHGAARADEHPV